MEEFIWRYFMLVEKYINKIPFFVFLREKILEFFWISGGKRYVARFEFFWKIYRLTRTKIFNS